MSIPVVAEFLFLYEVFLFPGYFFFFWRKHIRPLPHVGIQYQDPTLESDFVALDNYALSAMCVHHLWNLGHRRIAFLTDEIENQLSNERFLGYLRSMHEHGLSVEDRYCITWQRPYVNGVLPPGGTGDVECLQHLEKAFLNGPPPTAFVCVDNCRADILRKALEIKGLRVPEDISITGSFNTPEFFFNITGVCSMLENICAEAARHLLELIAEPRQTELKTILIRPKFFSGNTTRSIQKSQYKFQGEKNADLFFRKVRKGSGYPV